MPSRLHGANHSQGSFSWRKKGNLILNLFSWRKGRFNFEFIFDRCLKTCTHVSNEYLNFWKGCIIQLFRHEFECSPSEVCILCKTPLIESNVARVWVLQIISNNHKLYFISNYLFCAKPRKLNSMLYACAFSKLSQMITIFSNDLRYLKWCKISQMI